VVACWGDGKVILYELDGEGGIVDRFVAPPATDPHSASGRPSRAHCSLMLDDGRVASTDLGYDLLRVWRYEPGTGLVPDHEVVFPMGSEPRHLVRHPSGRILVIGEISVEAFVLSRGADGRYAIESSTPATQGGAQKGDTASEITTDAAGRYVLVSVRGRNLISTLAVHDDGARLEPVHEVSCGGDTPRHHLQLGRLLLVANQGSSNVTAFRLDAHSGVPEELIATVPVGTPTCLLPV
jgi:6-phosphogluconolactonase (cycloisomerase 2 family)